MPELISNQQMQINIITKYYFMVARIAKIYKLATIKRLENNGHSHPLIVGMKIGTVPLVNTLHYQAEHTPLQETHNCTGGICPRKPLTHVCPQIYTATFLTALLGKPETIQIPISNRMDK